MSCIRHAAFAASLLLTTAPIAMAQPADGAFGPVSVETRFGPVTVARNTLLFRGGPVTPGVVGDMGLGLGQVLQVGSYDAVIVRNNLGGNGCPMMFYVVAVTAQGAKASPSFGTCSEAADVSRKGDGVSLRMPTVSTLAQQRAGKGHPGQMHVFVVTNGAVTDNGKPVH